MLVHGTFARHAEWLQPESPIREVLDERLPGASWRVFCWSGANSQRARLLASRDLRENLRSVLADSPGLRLHFVAHSHGGNVVLGALDDELSSHLGSVTTLATPFVQFSPRYGFGSGVWAVVVLGAVAGLVGFAATADVPLVRWVVVTAAVAMGLLVLLGLSQGVRTTRTVLGGQTRLRSLLKRDERDRVMEGLNPPGATSADHLVLLPAADEAFGGLTTAQFSATLLYPVPVLAVLFGYGAVVVSAALVFVTPVVMGAVVVLSGIARTEEADAFTEEWSTLVGEDLEAFLASDAVALVERLLGIVGIVTLAVIILGFGVAIFRVIALLTFGSDIPGLAMVTRPLVTATPIGRSVTAQVVDTGGDGEGMHHGRIKNSVHVGTEIADWLSARQPKLSMRAARD